MSGYNYGVTAFLIRPELMEGASPVPLLAQRCLFRNQEPKGKLICLSI